jgi:hypothetical protein
MAQIKIAFINASTVLSDAQVEDAVPALQRQVHENFAQAWGIDADLDFVPRGTRPPGGHWWLAVLDNSDVAGALGYHDITREGLPLGKIFAGTDLHFGQQWTVTASHELLEMLADPDVNLSALVEIGRNLGRLYAYEVCDACEADEFGYEIDGVLVSDFVFPAWFESFRRPRSTQFDFGERISEPFELLPGGYISVLDFFTATGWRQHAADRPHFAMRARIGSRRERRRTPKHQWLTSDVDFGISPEEGIERARAEGPVATEPAYDPPALQLK